jgi:glycosyl transferase family 25
MVKIDKVFLINLNINKDRLERAKSELSYLGPPYSNFERFEAIYGKAKSDEEIFALTSISAYKTIKEGRSLHYELPSKGAVGCALSHYTLWKRMVDENINNALIFEDDIICNTNTKEINEYIDNIPNDYGIAFLDHINNGGKPYTPINNYWLINNDTNIFVTSAYVININGAKRLLSRAYPIDMQVDSYINYFSKYYPDFIRYYSGKRLLYQSNITTNIQDRCVTCFRNDNIDSMINDKILLSLFGIGILGFIFAVYLSCR